MKNRAAQAGSRFVSSKLKRKTNKSALTAADDCRMFCLIALSETMRLSDSTHRLQKGCRLAFQSVIAGTAVLHRSLTPPVGRALVATLAAKAGGRAFTKKFNGSLTFQRGS